VPQSLEAGARSASTDHSTLDHMDGFIVATPTSSHAAVLDRLMSTGRPVFVEKPMTADVVSARRLAALGAGRLFVMDKWRYHPAIEAIRREIAAGSAGDVLAIRTTRWGWGNPHPDVPGYWILAPHDLAIVLHLIGSIPPVVGVSAISPRQPDLGIIVQLKAPDGPMVTLDIGIASPQYCRRSVVIGTHATIELRDSYDDRIFVRDGAPSSPDARERTIATPGKLPLAAEIEAFLAFVAGGPPPMSTAAEGLLIVERVAQIEAALFAIA
jgi:predicted dehydrogenase